MALPASEGIDGRTTGDRFPDMIKVEWQEFIEQHYDRIFRFALQLLGSKEDAEDVTQHTFLKAYRSLKQLEDPLKAKAWLYSIARNSCRDHFRALRRLLTFFDYSNVQEQSYVSSYGEQELLRAIQMLPQMQREVFILREWHEFSTQETSELLKIAEGSVKSHLHRAKERLRRILQCPQAFTDSEVFNEAKRKEE